MKQIVAIVRPFLAEKVLEGLKRAPLEALNVREVKGFGRQKERLDEYNDNEYATAFLPKVEITLWVDETRVDEIVQKISEIARTGRMGDGKIFVMPTVDGTLDSLHSRPHAIMIRNKPTRDELKDGEVLCEYCTAKCCKLLCITH